MTFISSIYTDHFGLTGRPFSLLPDPDFIYWSVGHQHAYTMLEFGLQSFAPIILITGEVGVGKTTLIQQLRRSAPTHLSIGMVSNADGRRGKLLHWALSSLGQPIRDRTPYVRLFRQFETFLHEEAAQGRRTLLIIDEAQNLSEAMLEELRCFSNLNSVENELLQLILVGQPELRRTVAQPKLRQFSQRVASDFHLCAMSRDSVHAYIAHRLKLSGAAGEIFTPDARDVIFDVSRGLPRVVNQLCDMALVYAFAEDLPIVDAKLVSQVHAERDARWQNDQGSIENFASLRAS